MNPRSTFEESLRPLWDEGYAVNPIGKRWDQFVQTEWNKKVLNGTTTYFEFKAWESGALSARRDCFWGLGRFQEDYDD